ncbi:MAG: AvrD family protein [Hydrogenophaga sp.]|jgi:hypothetical protein|nr:AvrD family protein [Hydrogenophaga sp.]
MEIGYYDSIDEFLGQRHGRYFGDGYLKSAQTVRDFELHGGPHGMRFSSLGEVLLPDMWSLKGGSQQKPHLSTIDVIELALECLRQFRICLRRGHELSTDLLDGMSIVAGKSPIEDDMDAIPITGQVTHDGNGSEVMALRVGNMDVTLYMRPESQRVTRGMTFSRRPVELGQVLLNAEKMHASAMASPKPTEPGMAWSLSASFACALQLGQLLLYKLDKVERASSNTLWMKKTEIRFSDLVPCSGGVQPIHVHLDDVLKYDKPDGEWRRANVCASFCNTQITCRVTHRLPAPMQLGQ